MGLKKKKQSQWGKLYLLNDLMIHLMTAVIRVTNMAKKVSDLTTALPEQWNSGPDYA